MCVGIWYFFEWCFFDGMVVEICGNLMFGGGFVVMFMDVIVFC